MIILIHPNIILAQFSQAKEPFRVNITPPSPEAAALAKYADIPVSLYSGTPKISIPLYELKERELSLPISLTYHASGHKAGTIPTRTGLGWTLEASGVITRTVRGWPDENQTGFLYQATQHRISDFALGNKPAEQQYDWYQKMADGCKDMEPDLFYFNFAGYAGKFMFNWDGGIEIASSSNLKIIPKGMNPGTADFIDGWEAVGEDGTTFVFEHAIETTKVNSASAPVIGCALGLDQLNMPLSWYLSEIRSANGQSWIRFAYEGYYHRVKSYAMESQVHELSLAPSVAKLELIISEVYGQHLKGITTSSGQTIVDFVKGHRRTDVEGDAHALAEVLVKNNRGKVIKDWKFEYEAGSLLKLIKMTEWAGALSKPPYTFSYYAGGPPDAMSFNQDHWGFANQNSKQTLIPATVVQRINDGAWIVLPGANREPSAAGVLRGMLKEIQYPTGGKDVLEFEPHDFSFKQREELIKEVTIPKSYSGTAPDVESPPLTTHTDIKEFTLTCPTKIRLASNFTYRMLFANGIFPITVILKNKATDEELYRRSPGGVAQLTPDGDTIPEVKSLSDTVRLTAGTYTLVVSARKSPSPTMGQNSVWASVSYQECTGQFFTEIKQGGGVRIARITRQYGNGNPDKVTRYAYRILEDNREKSSGSLLESAFRYQEWLLYVEPSDGDTGSTGDPGTLVNKFFRCSQNRTALGTTQGSHVGYGTVTVLQGEHGENGKTVYTYTSPRQVSDYALFKIPYPPAQSYDYRRGLLLEQSEFDKSGSLLRKVQQDYAFQAKEVLALKVGWVKPGVGWFGPAFLDRYALGNYENILGYSRLKTTREIVYYPASPAVQFETVQFNTYNETTHKQLVKTIQTDSEADSLVTQMTYPEDYRTGTSTVLDAMRNRHMASPVVEKLVWKKNAAAQISLLSAMKTDYAIQEGAIYPSAVLGARIGEPVPTTDPLGTAQSRYEERLIYHRYDAYGNLLEHAMKDGMPTSYIWGENGTVVIARADYAKAQQVYHTSFEEDPQALTLQQKTGSKSRSMSGAYAIPAANRPAEKGSYVFTYWIKQGSAGWLFRRKTIVDYIPGTPIATEEINGYLDEVRLYPQGARMTTFTYEPLVGVTSVTDARNVTVYYEYDAFNRLKCKRDQDGNLLESNDYVFQEEVPYAIQN